MESDSHPLASLAKNGSPLTNTNTLHFQILISTSKFQATFKHPYIFPCERGPLISYIFISRARTHGPIKVCIFFVSTNLNPIGPQRARLGSKGSLQLSDNLPADDCAFPVSPFDYSSNENA